MQQPEEELRIDLLRIAIKLLKIDDDIAVRHHFGRAFQTLVASHADVSV